MQNAKILSSLHHIIESYQTKLNTYSDLAFQTTPPIGGWSYSEVYSHIFDISLLSLETLEKCLEGLGKNRPTAFAAKVILYFGMLPPGKHKVPKALASRVKVISKVEAAAMIQQFMQQLEQDSKQMSRARIDIKNPHPRLGYLNAAQWLRFIEIHLKHHLKQLNRIEKSF
ncbi:DUF1569 domain-containing protein [Pedobacter sp.]|uniref:DUF1569 domain-containing protein n=1 Tax=Pedobacter sp. TaxID=1411316 RepID=UPI003D7F673B